jgi:hypothetical protein
MKTVKTNVRVLLFARWIVTNFGTPEYDVNDYDGKWWKGQLEYFNKKVLPTMKLNGSVENTDKFLNEK